MVRDVMWSAWDGPGLGHLRLAVSDSGGVADGVVVGVAERLPFRLAFEVRCDARWRIRYARVGVPGEPPKAELLSDGEGTWTASDGRAVTYLEGCEYVDISETHFTNTLPIRRLGLSTGESADITVAYFDGTDLQPWPEPQRYTCLEKGDEGGLYCYLSLDGGFTADLPVDADGLCSTTRGCSGGSCLSRGPQAALLRARTSHRQPLPSQRLIAPAPGLHRRAC